MKTIIPDLAWLAMMMMTVAANAAPPRVVITSPDNGEVDVSADITELRIQFDQPMDPRGRSIVGGGDLFPEITGDVKWVDDRTMLVPIKLQGNHQYQLSINSDTFRGFVSKAGEVAEWYPVSFATRAQGAQPANPDVTPRQNKTALDALRKAIDGDYSYRDLTAIDWPARITAKQSEFENARSANAFARVSAHLLADAEDVHVFVEAGKTRIGTHANSASPNFNLITLRKEIPNWRQSESGLITGRFGDGIGYIAFSQCSRDQANAFDTALEQLHDATGLVIDVRFNGGGDEMAAQRVAGRFAGKPTIYSRDRIRQGGIWKGPFDRTLEPRADLPRYAKPIALLIGPKVVSSAESFVLMMRHGTDARLFGSTTCGSSGKPMPHNLGNGVTVYLPSWEDQTPDGSLVQNKGIEPDTVVKTNPRNLAQHDAVLDEALQYLHTKR